MVFSRVAQVLGVGAVVTGAVVIGLGAPGQAGPAVASATLVDINGNDVGSVRFTARGGVVVGRLEVVIDHDPTLNATDFNGVHLHANDDPANGAGCRTYDEGAEPAASARFVEVDGHWRVGAQDHGHHTGDLPSVVREHDGRATIDFSIDKLTADQLPGRALIVHLGADDFGKGSGTSLANGNAGLRFACGVVVASASGG